MSIRCLVNPAGASDLYADGARFYAPGLAAFTQLDSSQGGALDPLSLNRYLYAAADPETLIDPSGHRYCTVQNADNCDGYRPGNDGHSAALRLHWKWSGSAQFRLDDQLHAAI